MSCLTAANSLALSHGAVAALLVMLVVSPVGPGLLAFVLERRLLRPRSDYLSFLFGDVLLAVGVATVVGGLQRGDCSLSSTVQESAVLAGLLVGAVQWLWEVRAGAYSASQAVAPTKIWHQVVALPLLTGWVTAVGLLLAASGAWLSWRTLVALGCLSGWVCLLARDNRHVKLGHPPYDWRRLRPSPAPWSATSTTLRAGTNSTEDSAQLSDATVGYRRHGGRHD